MNHKCRIGPPVTHEAMAILCYIIGAQDFIYLMMTSTSLEENCGEAAANGINHNRRDGLGHFTKIQFSLPNFPLPPCRKMQTSFWTLI
jgi:hypothetical protein